VCSSLTLLAAVPVACHTAWASATCLISF
jgi:hypothetical protein